MRGLLYSALAEWGKEELLDQVTFFVGEDKLVIAQKKVTHLLTKTFPLTSPFWCYMLSQGLFFIIPCIDTVEVVDLRYCWRWSWWWRPWPGLSFWRWQWQWQRFQRVTNHAGPFPLMCCPNKSWPRTKSLLPLMLLFTSRSIHHHHHHHAIYI